MTGPVTIFHNPRCSKSRQTLDLLRARGVEPVIHEYLKDAPDGETLRSVLAKLGKSPREIMRSGESVYKELELSDPSLSDDALIEAMVANPILIERPIVIAGTRAALGRPPESVLEIL